MYKVDTTGPFNNMYEAYNKAHILGLSNYKIKEKDKSFLIYILKHGKEF